MLNSILLSFFISTSSPVEHSKTLNNSLLINKGAPSTIQPATKTQKAKILEIIKPEIKQAGRGNRGVRI
ncbi:hypothetical protein [Thalassomonas haliotis]|uniref:Uncharacterized protein n=1 Tax=Thalassomonas haliotis TaxID=485448 RepID=A0ABY7VIC7_9GAMM|nr:hypothetical protein [Thalassomonas haliotis]WDE13321.1 hypothetical protein H3N35_07745 [Thalassomonas haliotis]